MLDPRSDVHTRETAARAAAAELILERLDDLSHGVRSGRKGIRETGFGSCRELARRGRLWQARGQIYCGERERGLERGGLFWCTTCRTARPSKIARGADS